MRRPPHSTEVVSDRLAVTIAVSISTSGNSALLIGAGYMVVNELALNSGGLWSEAVFPPTLPT